MRRAIMTFIAVFMLSGCFHAVVYTGVGPGARQIEQKWAKSYAGLWPPDPVDGMAECGAAGVVRVETRLSFLNIAVMALTLGVFTPMEITVTCGPGEKGDPEKVTNGAGVEAALQGGQPTNTSRPVRVAATATITRVPSR